MGSIRFKRADYLQMGKGLLQVTNAFLGDFFTTEDADFHEVGHGI